jgi:hypothetical protein
MRGRQRWPGRGLAVVTATAALGAGLLASGAGAQAATVASSHRIAGGVEDGTFSPTCLRGDTARPPTSVLKATHYRNQLGQVVRILVPYDIAVKKSSKSFKCLNRYLAAAARHGVTMEVSLNRVRDHAPGPSLARYTTAVGDLARAEGSRIRYLTAWNEPNNPAYLSGSGAATRAGHYFVAARQAFPGKMVGGDFASGVGPGFLSRYVKAIGQARPGIWAIHPYTDLRNFQGYLAAGQTPRQAGAKAAARSKILQFARELHQHRYGPGTRIWINEIYVYRALGKTKFSKRNRSYAALFLAGGLGADSLPGVLAGQDLPQLTRYIYLRAWAARKDKQLPEAEVLEVHFRTCLYRTLAGHKTRPAPHCA